MVVGEFATGVGVGAGVDAGVDVDAGVVAEVDGGDVVTVVAVGVAAVVVDARELVYDYGVVDGSGEH